MIRNIFILIGLCVFVVASSGCRSGGTQAFTQGFGQQPIGTQILQGFGQQPIGSQILQGFQQPILGGNTQPVVGGGLPTAEQAQQAVGQFGQNIGSRISNGVINQGVNRLINGVFAGL